MLSHGQFGYRNDKRMVKMLSKLVDMAVDGPNKDMDAIAIMCYLAKAFDYVNVHILLRKY